MALSPNSLTLFISVCLSFLLLFSSFASARFSTEVSATVQNQICSKSDDPTYCSKFLQSIPEANSTNLHDLTQIVISLAHNSSDDNYSAFKSQIGQISDPELKKRYTACSKGFSNASDSLLNGEVSFQSGKFSDAIAAAKDAGADAHNCENEFNTPPFLPSYIQQRVYQFETICSIIQISIQLLQN